MSESVPRKRNEPSPLRGTTVPMTRLRRVIAQRAVASMTSMAQVTSVVEVDVSRAVPRHSEGAVRVGRLHAGPRYRGALRVDGAFSRRAGRVSRGIREGVFSR